MHPASGDHVPHGAVRDKIYWEGSPDPSDRDAADTVSRSFDQLGLLVREGAVPLNIIAHFYASPVLRCWYKLQPYVGVERWKRNQNGHLWEWENLVLRIVIPRIKAGNGIWRGISAHDGLEDYFTKIENQIPIDRDNVYLPAFHLWEL